MCSSFWGLEHAWPVHLPIRPVRWICVGSAFVDIGQSSLMYLFYVVVYLVTDAGKNISKNHIISYIIS